MSWEFSETTEQIAKKQYKCDACFYLKEALSEGCFDADDLRVFEAAKKEGFLILPGTVYIKTKGKFEGSFSVFRARLDADRICKKYNLYDYDS